MDIIRVFFRVATFGYIQLNPSAEELRKRIRLWDLIQWRKNYEKYGLTGTIVMIILPSAARLVKQIEEDILPAGPDQVNTFSKLMASRSNMISVAGAIVAQIAITALSLEGINYAHRSASGAFIISLVAGALAVFYSCVTHPAIMGLHGDEDIKDWLSSSGGYIPGIESLEAYKSLRASSLPLETREDALNYALPHRWKKGSPWAATILVVPSILLSISLNSFIVGLGVYLACLAVGDAGLRPGSPDSKADLIVYIVVCALGMFMYYMPKSIKDLEWENIEYSRLLADAVSLKGTNTVYQLNAIVTAGSTTLGVAYGSHETSSNMQQGVVEEATPSPKASTARNSSDSISSDLQLIGPEADLQAESSLQCAVLMDFILAQEQSVFAARRLLEFHERAQSSASD